MASELIRFSPTPGIPIEVAWDKYHTPVAWDVLATIQYSKEILGINRKTYCFDKFQRFLEGLGAVYPRNRHSLVVLLDIASREA